MNIREKMNEILLQQNKKEIKYIITKYITDSIDTGEFPSITKVSNNCFVSKTTVIRYTNDLGFEGYKDFINSIHYEENITYPLSFSKNDDPKFKIKQLKNQIFEFLDSNLLEEKTKDIADAITKARKVYLISSYEMSNITGVFADHLSILNFDVFFSSSTKTAFSILNHITKDDLFIFIIGGVDNKNMSKIWYKLDDYNRIVISSKSQHEKFTNGLLSIKLTLDDKLISNHNKELELIYLIKLIFIFLNEKTQYSYVKNPKFKR